MHGCFSELENFAGFVEKMFVYEEKVDGKFGERGFGRKLTRFDVSHLR